MSCTSFLKLHKGSCKKKEDRSMRRFFISTLLVAFCFPCISPGAGIKDKLDGPPKNRQKPYSPADNQQVAVTPPPFIWIPIGRNASYILQVSKNRAFSPDATRTFRGIDTSVFVPSEPLPAGKWFWRYGVATEKGDVFGRARPFSISADAARFPFPDFDKVIEKIPREHPRLLLSGKQLTRLRQAIKDELGRDARSLFARADRAIGEKLVAEPPRPKTGPERVYVMRTTRPPMDAMEQCALAYLLSQGKHYGLEAKRRLLHFFSWDPRGSTNLWSYDEPAMWVMMRGIRAYDWTYDLFTEAERKKIEPVMHERARQFYVHLKEKRRFETDPYESHAGRMPGFLGEAALCFAHKWPEAKKWLHYATLLYYTSYPAWGGDDGGWQEGPGYWSAYMSFALHYVVALRNITEVDLMKKPFFRNTPYYALYTATPYHEHRPFGDGATGSPRGLGTVLYAFSTLLQDPYLRWYHEESGRRVGTSILSLATYDPTLKPKNPEVLPQSRVFPSVGLAAFHSRLGDKEKDITLLLRSSPFGSVSHGHADQNAFVIEAFGRGLALATGYYPWYGSPHHRLWTRSTCSVNSILVNGVGQVRRSWDADGRIVTFKKTEDYDYLETEAAEAYGGRLERFRRHVYYLRPGTFIMFDDLIAKKPSTFQWLLHAHDKIAIRERTLSVTRPPACMKVQLLAPEKITFSQTDKYTPEPEEQEVRRLNWKNTRHLTASTTDPAKTACFLSVFNVYHEKEPAEFPSVRLVEKQGGRRIVLDRTDGKKFTIELP